MQAAKRHPEEHQGTDPFLKTERTKGKKQEAEAG